MADIDQLFRQNFDRMRKEDQARHFLVKVSMVQFANGSTDTFRVIGTRCDNGAKVAVTSVQEKSGQHLPEVGGIFRAEKAERLPPSAKNPDVTLYKAEYFHAYGSGEFCIEAVVQASRPVKNSETGMWSAQVHAFDLETNVQSLTADKLLAGSEFEQTILKALKPWSAERASSITHDVKGNALWGDGKTALPGLSPFVAIRFTDQVIKVYGPSVVKDSKGGKDILRLPTDAEILSRINSNPKLRSIVATAKEFPPEYAKDLARLPIHIIPGVSMQVGRDALSGSSETYLRLPDKFGWVNDNARNEGGQPIIQRGYIMANVHVKMSRKERMIVAHAVPTPTGQLSKTIPETRQERELRARLAEQQQHANQPASAPAPAQRSQQPQSSATAPAPAAAARRPAPAPSSTQKSKPQFDDRELGGHGEAAPHAPAKSSTHAPVHTPEAEPEFDSMGHEDFDASDDDYLTYAEDIAAIEMMNSSDEGFDDHGVDDLLSEAADRQARRHSRPTM